MQVKLLLFFIGFGICVKISTNNSFAAVFLYKKNCQRSMVGGSQVLKNGFHKSILSI